MSKNVSEVLSASMSKVREMVDANTVLGDPITVGEGTTLIPISRIGFALASGGADLNGKNGAAVGNFGGGAGCGVKITPVGLICITGEKVRVIPVAEPASTASERLIEQIPELIEKVSQLLEDKIGKKSEITEI